MKLSLPAGLVRQSLAGHSWLGVLTGALMYLICLSGTIAVFYQELERWEQPQIAESLGYDAATLERAYAQVPASDITHHMFISLPTEEIPRTSISTEKTGWFVNTDGSLGQEVKHEWTHLIINLHLYLHLPETFGLILVGVLGALLCGLIVSGILAHPRIFKDAFALRLGGSRLLEQADIHNRLSVWSLPFQLMIAITGAFFGLAQLMVLLLSYVYTDGDTEALMARVYGAEPKLEQAAQPLAIGKALAAMKTIAPGATPFYITVEEADVPEKRFMIVGAEHPGRLIYAEQYRFDSAGNYLDNVGFSDGETGQQAIFSVYRLHFGHFASFSVKVLYGVLGLAMTIVCVTGFNIWLARRKHRDHWNNLWAGFVWGTVPALALSGIAQVIFGTAATAVLWIGIAAATALAQWWNDERLAKQRFEFAATGSIVVLIVAYTVKFGAAAFSSLALTVNATLAAIAITFAYAATRRGRLISASRSTPADLSEGRT
ncbi:putative iron-regulated membrane protein [Povalibacter uvarum]|uniref:Putative iron-regulated membrane protein n=1 Tax=Povalibacter uvarum TaxID=732238 RepID=A0A841HSC5_9GAMM|nr:PepSY-associated TM helix domain-containing protein [Povalibacter uvarum]MBB6095554.1 putative iron-regulated membrane protein [Povalibacter uvarum]